MVVAAPGSALSPSFWVLIAFRFLPGFGVGSDYPVSAVLMSEYANRKNRGKLVGMVFGTQALGLIAGPLVALALLGLRVSEATGAGIAHLGLERGHRTLTITAKGGKVVGLEEPSGWKGRGVIRAQRDAARPSEPMVLPLRFSPPVRGHRHGGRPGTRISSGMADR